MASYRLFIFLIFILIAPNIIFSTPEGTVVEVFSEEHGTILSFFDDYFVVKLNGTLTVTNYELEPLYELQLDIRIGTLTFRTEGDLPDSVRVGKQQIVIDTMPGNTSYEFKYSLFGITSDKSLIESNSILMNGIRRGGQSLNSQTFGSLQKAEMEDPEKGGNPNTRLITAFVRNPYSFDFSLNEVRIIKTSGMNLNQYMKEWRFTKEDNLLRAREEWTIDFLDKEAVEGQIYWLQAGLDVPENAFYLDDWVNISKLSERDIYLYEMNETNATDNISAELDFLVDRLYIRKIVSNTLVAPGQEIEITLLINNFAANDVTNVTIKDLIPPGFVLVDSRNAIVDNLSISWFNVVINARETRRITYTLRYIDEESYGLDYFEPAELLYGEKKVVSESIPFVRKYMPERRLFIQKNIQYISEDQVKVILQLQNLGETALTSLVLNELLSDDAEFKEVSQVFSQKGIWKIDRIEAGETYEISYVTNRVNVLNSFPTVYGIEGKSVMKTIILSNVIKTNYNMQKVRFIEIGGLIFILIILILIFLPKDFFRFRKKRDLSILKQTEKELGKLKSKTSSIDLTNDSNDKPKIKANINIHSYPSKTKELSERESLRMQLKDEIDSSEKNLSNIKKKYDEKKDH